MNNAARTADRRLAKAHSEVSFSASKASRRAFAKASRRAAKAAVAF